ncbi:MAG: mannose-1-phosphate guanylyltransferase, partial [Helicobacter sp.]|nr:mannose-1-phosphate guanylyltransferase [Helicobacter sp.]
MLKVAILCGGSGARLWPLSRTNFPKQFSKIIGDYSLFQACLLRNAPLLEEIFAPEFGSERALEVISNEKFQFLIEDQASEVGVKLHSLLLESSPKNTAAAICLCCLNSKPDDLILVLPSDHIISSQNSYIEAIKSALDKAKEGYITTIGIAPNSPHTGYGYIQIGEKITFKEKPDIKTAQKYLQEGGYFWNAGIFAFRSDVMLQAMVEFESEIFNACKSAFESAKVNAKESSCATNATALRINTDAIKEQSIDFAIMERADNITCVCANFDWNDVGSFDSLAQEFDKDAIKQIQGQVRETKSDLVAKNTKSGRAVNTVNTGSAAQVVSKNSSNNFIRS